MENLYARFFVIEQLVCLDLAGRIHTHIQLEWMNSFK